jgi:nucleotide-binding universal stress UspA family protein
MDPMTIVAATDFSDAARAAVDRAVLIAREHKAQLVLVYAFDERSWANLRSLATPKKNLLSDQPLARAWETVRRTAQRIERKHEVPVSGMVAIGQASEAIASTATDAHASLIVLGPHARRLGDRLYLGSTALGLARIATCPVLVVRNRPGTSYANCLVGVDFSPASQRAATTVARLFPSAAITLLHAVLSVEGPMLFTGALREAINAAKEKLRKEALDRLAHELPAGQTGQLNLAKYRAVIGPAHAALSRALANGRYDLLALGRDAKAQLVERVLGSVPANLLVSAPTDVLITP